MAQSTASKTSRARRQSTPPESGVVRSVPQPEPTHEAIALRAYELFVERGRQHGFDRDDWCRAEAELRAAE